MKLMRPFSSRSKFNSSSSMGNNGAGQSSGANNSSRQSSFGEKRSQDVSDSYITKL